jgi:hypothetical protein
MPARRRCLEAISAQPGRGVLREGSVPLNIALGVSPQIARGITTEGLKCIGSWLRPRKGSSARWEIDAFGSPCYVLDGEVFWGQDRIELLDDALTSGRKAYRNDI